MTPVKGVKEVLAKKDPELAENQLIFPDAETLRRRLHLQRAVAGRRGGARRALPADHRGVDAMVAATTRGLVARPRPSGRRRGSGSRAAPSRTCCSRPGLLWLAFFFAAPLYFMARQSLESGHAFTGYEFTWEFSNYTDGISDFSEQLIRSFQYAGVSTMLALLIGYPLAYAIATRGGKWRTALILLVILPSLTTYLVRTLAWQTILDDSSPTVDVLQTLGLIGDDGRLLATSGAVIAGITYNFLPFMILPLYASLERFDKAMLEAAYDLYASRFKAFWRVTLPLSMPGIVAGCLLTFIPAAGDFVNAQLLGSSRQYMIGNVIQSRYNVLADYPTAAALSFMLMAIVLVLVIVWVRIAGTRGADGERGGVSARRHRRPRAEPLRPRSCAPTAIRGCARAGRWAARQAAERLRGARDDLPAVPDRDRDPVLLQRHEGAASTSPGRGSPSGTGRTRSRSPS